MPEAEGDIMQTLGGMGLGELMNADQNLVTFNLSLRLERDLALGFEEDGKLNEIFEKNWDRIADSAIRLITLDCEENKPTIVKKKCRKKHIWHRYNAAPYEKALDFFCVQKETFSRLFQETEEIMNDIGDRLYNGLIPDVDSQLLARFIKWNFVLVKLKFKRPTLLL